jgi:hypothetical protein
VVIEAATPVDNKDARTPIPNRLVHEQQSRQRRLSMLVRLGG